MVHNCNKEERRKIVGMAEGDFVMYTDVPTSMQVSWGGHDHPDKAGMKIGELYEVSEVEIHDSYTHVMFKGVVGRFNPLSFVIIDPEDKSDVAEMRDHAFGRAETARREFINEFKEKANRWIASIQKCGLTFLNDCRDCQFYENCQAIQKKLVLMKNKLAKFVAENDQEQI
jgi:hypothetical protein